jgi:aminomethyltransferase
VTEALLAARPEARLVGLEAFDEARIWAGVPRFGVDFDTDFLPSEAGLESHLSHNKGCYVGQEIHARLHFRGHPNRKLVALRLPAALAEGLASEAALYAGGQHVGRITSLARLARKGLRAGIGLLRYQVTQERPRLALAPDGEAAIDLAPVATDLGAPRA